MAARDAALLLLLYTFRLPLPAPNGRQGEKFKRQSKGVRYAHDLIINGLLGSYIPAKCEVHQIWAWVVLHGPCYRSESSNYHYHRLLQIYDPEERRS